MVGAAYAAVPLYDWFCRTTGFGGTTQVATAAPGRRCSAAPSPCASTPMSRPGCPGASCRRKTSIDVRIGEVLTVNYTVTNLAARETVGQASYNVTPPTTGAYFQKINCFCFTEQTMKPGETREMPVVFYVDPALAKDAEQNGLNTITLSYTYFPVQAGAAGGKRAGCETV